MTDFLLQDEMPKVVLKVGRLQFNQILKVGRRRTLSIYKCSLDPIIKYKIQLSNYT